MATPIGATAPGHLALAASLDSSPSFECNPNESHLLCWLGRTLCNFSCDRPQLFDRWRELASSQNHSRNGNSIDWKSLRWLGPRRNRKKRFAGGKPPPYSSNRSIPVVAIKSVFASSFGRNRVSWCLGLGTLGHQFSAGYVNCMNSKTLSRLCLEETNPGQRLDPRRSFNSQR